MADDKKPLPPRTKPRRRPGPADQKKTKYVGTRRKPEPPKKA